jgi:hypothetical protein
MEGQSSRLSGPACGGAQWPPCGEMREVAETVRQAGIPSLLASASAEFQDWLTSEMRAAHYTFSSDEAFSWRALVDLLNPSINSDPKLSSIAEDNTSPADSPCEKSSTDEFSVIQVDYA